MNLIVRLIVGIISKSVGRAQKVSLVCLSTVLNDRVIRAFDRSVNVGRLA